MKKETKTFDLGQELERYDSNLGAKFSNNFIYGDYADFRGYFEALVGSPRKNELSSRAKIYRLENSVLFQLTLPNNHMDEGYIHKLHDKIRDQEGIIGVSRPYGEKYILDFILKLVE